MLLIQRQQFYLVTKYRACPKTSLIWSLDIPSTHLSRLPVKYGLSGSEYCLVSVSSSHFTHSLIVLSVTLTSSRTCTILSTKQVSHPASSVEIMQYRSSSPTSVMNYPWTSPLEPHSCDLFTSQGHSGRGNLNWENAAMASLWSIFFIDVDKGEPSSLWVVAPLSDIRK